MPASNVWGLEWLNSNSVRSYPLAVDATKLDQSETFKIPDSFILSLYLPVNSSVNLEVENLYVQSLTIFSTGLTLTIGYNDGTEAPPEVASASMSFSDHYEYRSYPLIGTGEFDESRGKVVFGKLEDLQALSAGYFIFDYAGGKLDTDCVRPNIRGVSGLRLVNSNDISEKITGIVEFVAGTNMQISVVQTVGQTTQIRFDAISGEGLSKDCVCTGDNVAAPCIRTINGVGPTEAGDFTITTEQGFTITPQSNSLKFQDISSKPCCGCNELEAVTRDLTKFGDSALTLQNYLNRLEGSVNRMNLTVLGSRLGDAPCVT